ncbi:MAG: endonuclease III [Rhodothermales bacterium]|nr:endonuclease III [Rhodothermales bacterium]MDG2016428.1 endonuclease III [Rhodothermales bacterium]HAY35841.1 endonuclease III [Bacteroidota bacterium]
MTRKQRADNVFSALRKVITEPETELNYQNNWQLLVSVLLSAQCTDARVNMVTPSLFERYPDSKTMAESSQSEIFKWIRSISYPNAKAGHLHKAAIILENEFGSEVPGTVDELVKLPGVGRKTAQVVASVAFGVPALAVDTHVFRVANRISLVGPSATTPDKVEKQLKKLLPPEEWGDAHHLMILHGRYHCMARNPGCDTCVASEFCDYAERLKKLPSDQEGLIPSKGKYYCATRKHYFMEPDTISDRSGVEQVSCPSCGSMNVFISKTGRTTRRIKDFRV